MRARELLVSTPYLERIAVKIWRISRANLIWCRHRLTMLKNMLTGNYSSLIDVDKVHWVDPATIEYCALEEFNIERYKGSVIGGDWDHLSKRFNDLDIYVAFSDVFSGSCEWSDTVFFKRVANDLANGQVHWRCRTREDLVRRCKELDSLLAEIRTHGYMSQEDLASAESNFDTSNLDDEITVSIGRHGDLLFSNSAHRLCIAKLLEFRSVPVKIAVRHRLWIRHVKRTGSPEDVSGNRG
jgi:hypothetical protein